MVTYALELGALGYLPCGAQLKLRVALESHPHKKDQWRGLGVWEACFDGSKEPSNLTWAKLPWVGL